MPKRGATRLQKSVIKAIKRSEDRKKETHRRSWAITSTIQVPEAGILIPNTNGGTDYVLNACLQGTDSDQRTGSQVKEVGLRIKGMVHQNSSNVDAVCGCMRLLIVRDHDNKSATPTLAEVLDISSSPANIGSLGLWSNRKRFSFLLDHSFSLQAQASGTAAASACAAIDIDLRKSVVNNLLTYQSNALSATTLNDGGIYAWLIYCNMISDPTTVHLPRFIGSVNFFFKDV